MVKEIKPEAWRHIGFKYPYLQVAVSGIEHGSTVRAVFMSVLTDIANSMAEMFTMQRLQHDVLKKNNLHHFDSWAATFGEPVTAMELSPDGAAYRLNTRFARLINVPELMQMFRQSADVQTAAMLNLPRPKLDGEKPTICNAPVTEELWRSFSRSPLEPRD